MNDVPLQQAIATIGGVLITIALAYVPRLRHKWDKLDGSQRRGWLALAYVAVAAFAYIPACTGGPQLVACDVSSIWDTVVALGLALTAGQGAYTMLPDERKQRLPEPPGEG